MRITYTPDTDSLNFQLTLQDSRPIDHRQVTDIPLIINIQRIGRVSAPLSTKISADS